MIYLACPYSHEDFYTIQTRVQQCAEYARFLASSGHMVYAPIVHGHVIETHTFSMLGVAPAIPYEYWINHGLQMLERCELLMILMLTGWSTSKGIAKELEVAERLKMRVEYRAFAFSDV